MFGPLEHAIKAIVLSFTATHITMTSAVFATLYFLFAEGAVISAIAAVFYFTCCGAISWGVLLTGVSILNNFSNLFHRKRSQE